MKRSDNRLRLVVRKTRAHPAGAPRERWMAYEAEKAMLAETACSASEYEAGLRDLAERFGV